MDFINHTPFPSLAFEAIDQHRQRFHVIVLRQTLRLSAGTLSYSDEQIPICEVDSHFDTEASSSVRQESDLCPYKPRCDVLVNGTAYTPKDTPLRSLAVRLTVKQADAQLPGRILLDKTLNVTGERQFRKRLWPVRFLQWWLKVGTLTLIRPSPWYRTRAAWFTSLPLRYEFAFGGDCKIRAHDKAANRVPIRHRLPLVATVAGGGAAKAPTDSLVAHAVFEHNPIGQGFAQDWALKATRCSVVPAPRIELPGLTVTAKLFWRCQMTNKKLRRPNAQQLSLWTPAGMGARSKSTPARAALLGTINDAFIRSDIPLPADFDFSYFNAAPLDQQLDHLTGSEEIGLLNLCPPNTPGLTYDAQGNGALHCVLPGHECFALIRCENGQIYSRPLIIDTVLIEPTENIVTLVWRLSLPNEEDAAVRACELRVRTHAQRDQMRNDLSELTRMAQMGPGQAKASSVSGAAK